MSTPASPPTPPTPPPSPLAGPSSPLVAPAAPLLHRVFRRVLRWFGADPDATPAPEVGQWPTTRQMFLWDLSPHDVAPNSDGVVLPKPTSSALPAWIMHLDDAAVEKALEVQRRVTRERQATVAAVEQKASRLLTPFVALIAGAVALTTFQLAAIEFDRPIEGWLSTFGAAFGVLGCTWLVMGLSRALDADTRMGAAIVVSAERELTDPRTALWFEARGATAASFVGKGKANRILHARSAISRAITMLAISAVLAGAVVVIGQENDAEVQRAPAHQSPAPATQTVTLTPEPLPTVHP